MCETMNMWTRQLDDINGVSYCANPTVHSKALDEKYNRLHCRFLPQSLKRLKPQNNNTRTKILQIYSKLYVLFWTCLHPDLF